MPRHIGFYQPINRGAFLIGAVRTAKALYRLIRAPSCLHDVVRPLLAVLVATVGMEGKPGTSRLREHENVFLAILERLRISRHSRRAALFHLELAIFGTDYALSA